MSRDLAIINDDSRWAVQGFQMDILADLKKEQTNPQLQLNGIQVGIAALSGANKTPVERSARQWKGTGWKRVMSAAARAKISRALKNAGQRLRPKRRGRRAHKLIASAAASMQISGQAGVQRPLHRLSGKPRVAFEMSIITTTQMHLPWTEMEANL